MPRWVKFLIALALGITIGLLYAWLVSPVEYVDIAPGSLRADYQVDTVLMVAKIYHAQHDLDAAARDLTMLGSDPPAAIAAAALRYAFENDYPNEYLNLLQELTSALQTWQPGGGAP